MAEKKKYEGFPKILAKGENETRSTRVAYTPTDENNLTARGYVVDEKGTKDYQSEVAKATEKTEADSAEANTSDEQTGGADQASAVAGSAEAPKTDSEDAKVPAPKANTPRPPRAN
jgi:hypothetical protein